MRQNQQCKADNQHENDPLIREVERIARTHRHWNEHFIFGGVVFAGIFFCRQRQNIITQQRQDDKKQG